MTRQRGDNYDTQHARPAKNLARGRSRANRVVPLFLIVALLSLASQAQAGGLLNRQPAGLVAEFIPSWLGGILDPGDNYSFDASAFQAEGGVLLGGNWWGSAHPDYRLLVPGETLGGLSLSSLSVGVHGSVLGGEPKLVIGGPNIEVALSKTGSVTSISFPDQHPASLLSLSSNGLDYELDVQIVADGWGQEKFDLSHIDVEYEYECAPQNLLELYRLTQSAAASLDAYRERVVPFSDSCLLCSWPYSVGHNGIDQEDFDYVTASLGPTWSWFVEKVEELDKTYMITLVKWLAAGLKSWTDNLDFDKAWKPIDKADENAEHFREKLAAAVIANRAVVGLIGVSLADRRLDAGEVAQINSRRTAALTSTIALKGYVKLAVQNAKAVCLQGAGGDLLASLAPLASVNAQDGSCTGNGDQGYLPALTTVLDPAVNPIVSFSCSGAVCGNGTIEESEECDDGDSSDGNGCSNDCSVEDGFTCTGQPSVCVRAPVSHLIAANAGAHGVVIPSGFVMVVEGASITLQATPNAGFAVANWYRNGSLAQAGGTVYTIPNVQDSYSIFVTFTEQPGLSVTSPIPGGQYMRHNRMDITWESRGQVGDTLAIQLWQNAGVRETLQPAAPNDGSDRWYIPKDYPLGTGYRICLVGGSTSACSGSFEIIEDRSGQPIEISSIQQLQQIGSDGAHPITGNYVLTGNINATGFNFAPLPEFKGTLDGNGHSITGLTISRPSQSDVGLFTEIDDKGTVKNVVFNDVEVVGLSGVGAVAGENYGQITNCAVMVKELSNAADQKFVGGVAGINHDTGVIRNCSVSTRPNKEIEGNGDNNGGIAGANGGLIEWCRVDGEVNGDDVTGGIVGQNEESGVVRQSWFAGVCDGDDDSGGIGGENYGTIQDCLVTGDTTGNRRWSGGCVGPNRVGGVVSRCLVAGAVNPSSVNGGVVGQNQSTVADSFFDIAAAGLSWCVGSDSTGSIGGCGCYGRTVVELQQKALYEGCGWDFENVWDIGAGSLPWLRGVGGALAVPEGFEVTGGDPSGVLLEWQGVAGAAVYHVYRAEKTFGSQTIIGDWQAGLEFVDSTATPYEEYRYWVSAAATTQGARESMLAGGVEGLEGWRAQPPLDPPAWVSATDNEPNSVLVEWGDVTGGNYFRVFRSETASGALVAIGSWVAGRSLVDTPPVADKTYFYWVTAARDNAGTGESRPQDPDAGSFYVPDTTAPSVSVFLNPTAPIETQDVTVFTWAADDREVDRVLLHWNDGADQSYEWNGISASSHSGQHEIGNFLAGQLVTYWVEVWDTSGNRSMTGTGTVTILPEQVFAPSRPEGPSKLRPGEWGAYQSTGVPTTLGYPIEYQYSWKTGELDVWGYPNRSYWWGEVGEYSVRVRARSAVNNSRVSEWSDAMIVTIQTDTPTPTATRTATATWTFTRTLTPTPTWTLTRTMTPTATWTFTRSPTQTTTRTRTATPTPTDTPTWTHTPTATRTRTPTRTSTWTATETPIPTDTRTATATGRPMVTDTPATESPTPSPTPCSWCVGDCDDSGEVTVNELILGVNVALNGSGVGACAAFDCNGNGHVTVDELVNGVNNALTGCP